MARYRCSECRHEPRWAGAQGAALCGVRRHDRAQSWRPGTFRWSSTGKKEALSLPTCRLAATLPHETGRSAERQDCYDGQIPAGEVYHRNRSTAISADIPRPTLGRTHDQLAAIARARI